MTNFNPMTELGWSEEFIAEVIEANLEAFFEHHGSEFSIAVDKMWAGLEFSSGRPREYFQQLLKQLDTPSTGGAGE